MTEKEIKGRVLYISKDTIYIAKGHKIYKSIDFGSNYEIWSELPISKIDKIIMNIPILSRLLRKSIHHLVIYNNIGIIIANKNSYLVKNSITRLIEKLHGSRPMCLCKTKDNNIYYGEYRPNNEKSKISIWKYNKLKLTWDSIYSFFNVRHIHGVFYDHFDDTIWVTTGDKDEEAGIWSTNDDFKTLNKIAGGSQQVRAVQLLFSSDKVYFGSDAPDEKNHIYRMNKDGTNIEKLAEVGSSIFYGTKINNTYYFSTAIEPSECNKTAFVELWKSDNGEDWFLYKRLEKDIWSMKYFQYGQILFPNQNDSKKLFYSPFAVKNKKNTICIEE